MNNTYDMNDNFFASKRIFGVLWSRRVPLSVLTLIGLVSGFVFSGPKFIVPRYKSHAVVYPSNISSYSEESETEQYMQWVMSQQVMDSIIEQYNLYDHYGIYRNDPHSLSYMISEYGKMVKFEQNVYDAVVISVTDKDPVLACNMVNSIINVTDYVIRTAQQAKFKEVIPNASIGVRMVNHYVDSLKNVMEATKEYGNLKGVDVLGDPDYMSSLLSISALGDVRSKVVNNYVQSVRDASRNFTYANVVSKPFVADEKSYPVRWIIVLVSGFSLLFFGILVFLIVDGNEKNHLK